LANLLTNVQNALEGFRMKETYGLLNSSVVPHWLKGGGENKQFIASRVKKLLGQPEITWCHVPTNQNPAALASRGGKVNICKLWWQVRDWLSNESE